MKLLFVLLAGAGLYALGPCCADRAEAAPAPSPIPQPTAQAPADSPFACNMSALSSKERKRHFGTLSNQILAARRSASAARSSISVCGWTGTAGPCGCA